MEDWAEIRRLHRAEGLPIKMPGPLAESRANELSTSAFWGTPPSPDQRDAKIARLVGVCDRLDIAATSMNCRYSAGGHPDEMEAVGV